MGYEVPQMTTPLCPRSGNNVAFAGQRVIAAVAGEVMAGNGARKVSRSKVLATFVAAEQVFVFLRHFGA
ncbi:hypothetical protein StoSoilB22_17920 [Arthrobacter sp. StoSoilB22]|nr:hypothetical protein StoSoilB22_17920 [Arthrobacter sp. StoSoilB22]